MGLPDRMRGVFIMSVEWIMHKGQNILYVNFRGMKEAELLDNLERAYRTVSLLPGKVLLLNNVEDVMISRNFMDRAKEYGKPNGESRIKKSAIVGINPLKAVLLQGYKRDTGSQMQSFDTEEQAKDWLVEP
jgi:hypothetical protein